jgi:hypothetical protein
MSAAARFLSQRTTPCPLCLAAFLHACISCRGSWNVTILVICFVNVFLLNYTQQRLRSMLDRAQCCELLGVIAAALNGSAGVSDGL